MGDVTSTNTPYDDVFRTLLNDCCSLMHRLHFEKMGIPLQTIQLRLEEEYALSSEACRKYL